MTPLQKAKSQSLASVSSPTPRIGFGMTTEATPSNHGCQHDQRHYVVSCLCGLQVNSCQAGVKKSLLFLVTQPDVCLCGAGIWSVDQQVCIFMA